MNRRDLLVSASALAGVSLLPAIALAESSFEDIITAGFRRHQNIDMTVAYADKWADWCNKASVYLPHQSVEQLINDIFNKVASNDLNFGCSVINKCTVIAVNNNDSEILVYMSFWDMSPPGASKGLDRRIHTAVKFMNIA